MSEYQDVPSNEAEETTVQIDAYGIKTKVSAKPKPDLERDPESWQEVWQIVHKQLMRCVVEPFKFVANSFAAASSFVRGAGNLPDHLGKRISKGHDLVDRQQAAQALFPVPSHSQAKPDLNELDALMALVEKFEEKGIACRIQIQDGKAIIVMGKEERVGEMMQAAENSIESSEVMTPAIEDKTGNSK